VKSRSITYGEEIDGYSRQEISKLLKTLLTIIPFVAFILAAINYSLGDYTIVAIILIVPFFCLFSFFALIRGRFRISITIIIAVLIASTTLGCIFGSGVHTTGVIIFPVIVLFSGLVLNIRGVAITTLSIIIGLAIIVFGELYQSYPFYPAPEARWVDLIIVLSITLVHIFVTYSFSSITRKNLSRAKLELNNQVSYQQEISTNLEEKTELLRLVHHRVKNNLLLINSLIELETYGRQEIKTELSDLTTNIHTIARAHDPLYHTEDYKQVSIKPYLEKVISYYVQSLEISNLEVELQDEYVFHEKAILLSIMLQKFIAGIPKTVPEKFSIFLTKNESFITLKLVIPENTKTESILNPLINQLTKELNGEIRQSANEVSIIFKG